jgi:hypothetical protein
LYPQALHPPMIFFSEDANLFATLHYRKAKLFLYIWFLFFQAFPLLKISSYFFTKNIISYKVFQSLQGFGHSLSLHLLFRAHPHFFIFFISG